MSNAKSNFILPSVAGVGVSFGDGVGVGVVVGVGDGVGVVVGVGVGDGVGVGVSWWSSTLRLRTMTICPSMFLI